MRLIDADALKLGLQSHFETVEQDTTMSSDFQSGAISGLEAAEFEIRCSPTINAASIIYAYWEEELERERKWHCSNCGTVQGVACIVMNYCPHCGAKMAEHPLLADGIGQTFSPD